MAEGTAKLDIPAAKKAIIQVKHDDRPARLILNRRPPAEGWAWLKYEDDGQEFEADLGTVQLVALLEGCGSPLLLGFCEQLYDQAYRYRQLAARKAYKRRNELDEHRAIFDAVLGGQLEEAQRLMAAHYRRTAGIFIEESRGVASPP